MSSVTDKKSFIKNAVQVGLSVGLISLAAGNPLAITPSFGMDDTDHQEHLIQRGRSTFAIEDDTDLQIQSTSQTHEKEWSKNDSTSLSIAPITEAFNLYQGIKKARSLYAEIEKKHEESLRNSLPKNVITHEIETEEEFIKKNPSVRSSTYEKTKEQYKKTTKAAEAILKNIQKDYIITERWINDPKTVERMACRMNHTYQKARDQGLSPQESWLKVGMIAQSFVEGQVGISPRKEQANALILKAGEVAAKYTVAAMTSAFLNEYGAYLSGKMVDLIHQMSNRLSGYVAILTSFQKEGFISKDSTERHQYHLKKDFVRSLKNFSSKIHKDHGMQVLANPIPKEQGPKVLSQPMTDVGVRLKGFDGIPEELIGYAKILSYPKAQNHNSSWILGFPIYQDPKEGMILMRNEDPIWNIRPGQEWKEKIIGKAQKTGTEGHRTQTYKEAIRLAKQLDVKKIYLDKGVNRVLKDMELDKIKPNRRPDVTYVTKDRKIHQIEVMSKTDKRHLLDARMEDTKINLPKAQRGTTDTIKIKEWIQK